MVFSEECLRDIEKRTRSHDLWSLGLTCLKKKSKHALHDAANRDGPQWDEFQFMRGVVQEVVNWKDTLDPFMKELNLTNVIHVIIKLHVELS